MTPILPWLAHLYTATGAVIALLATGLTFAHNFRGVFIYFIVATFVDATDGVLARALKVKEIHPQLGRHLGPPCVLRNKIVSPRCTEGTHFCGVPVWNTFPNVERRL